MAVNQMMYIDPHIHMTSRTTYDYLVMRQYGVVATIEPSFWLGQPRTSVGTFKDYFSSLIGWERFRAGQFGIRHYCTISLNPKEANNEALAEQVMELLPMYLCKEGVVAIGEIGYDEMTAAEDKYFRQQLELAKELDMLVLAVGSVLAYIPILLKLDLSFYPEEVVKSIKHLSMLNFDNYPGVLSYINRLGERPGFQKTIATSLPITVQS